MPKLPSKKPRSRAATTPKGLNPQERLFVDEYLKDLDAQRAALTAGYSKTVARSKAYSWVSSGRQKPHVYASVLSAIEKRSRRNQVTADRVLEELGRLAFSDVRKLYDDQGRLKAPHEIDDDSAAAIASVETIEEFDRVPSSAGEKLEPQAHGGALSRGTRTLVGYTRKLKMHSKPEALRLAMQHLGMLRAQVDVDLTGRIAYQVDFGSPQG